jgi:hypothetical protein
MALSCSDACASSQMCASRVGCDAFPRPHEKVIRLNGDRVDHIGLENAQCKDKERRLKSGIFNSVDGNHRCVQARERQASEKSSR